MTILTASRYRVLPNISYKAFSYPGDEEALEALKRVPGVSQLFHWLIDNVLEEYYNVTNLYNSVKLGPDNYPRIHAMVEDCCQILDMPRPEVYIAYNPAYNAYTYGVDRTFITLHSSLAEGFTEAELRSIIGHELGHIKAGHVLYKSVGYFIIKYLPYLDQFVPFPIGSLLFPMIMAMQEWSRRAEFTCDRAGLLCCQDPDASMNALAKFAGRLGEASGSFNHEALIQQAAQVHESASKTARIFVALDSLGRTHPYSVLRVKQISEWVASGAFEKIMEGDYARDLQGAHELGPRHECSGCKRPVNSKLRYCPHCGTGLKKAGPRGSECQLCGSALASFAEFCGVCGTKVRGRQAPRADAAGGGTGSAAGDGASENGKPGSGGNGNTGSNGHAPGPAPNAPPDPE